MQYRINFDAFASRLGRAMDVRDTHIRGILHACILRDRVVMPYTHATCLLRLCNTVVDLAKENTADSHEKLECLFNYNPFARQKLMNQMLNRYALRDGNYVRVTKCGIDTKHGFELALLEYVDAPGDTVVELAKRTIPVLELEQKRVHEKITDMKRLIEDAKPYIPDFSYLKADERIEMQAELEVTELESRSTEITKELEQLRTALKLAFLPAGYSEEKWPPASKRVVVWRRPYTVYYAIKHTVPQPRKIVTELKNPAAGPVEPKVQAVGSRGYTSKTYYRRVPMLLDESPAEGVPGAVRARGCEGDYF